MSWLCDPVVQIRFLVVLIAANAILSAVGYNFRRILAWRRALLGQILIAVVRAFIIRSALRAPCELAVKLQNCCEFENREEIKTQVECCLGRRGEQRHRAPAV
jgi:hypothetical protein